MRFPFLAASLLTLVSLGAAVPSRLHPLFVRLLTANQFPPRLPRSPSAMQGSPESSPIATAHGNPHPTPQSQRPLRPPQMPPIPNK